jgi:exopolysaccharide production protein ExoY
MTPTLARLPALDGPDLDCDVDAPLLQRDVPVRVRLGLQRRAPTNIRRHLLRALRRFLALVVTDLASFSVIRELVRAVRDYAVLGTRAAEGVRETLPAGILTSWEYAAALFVGLLVTGNYGPGDRRRSPWRLFLASALATALPLWMAILTRGPELLVQYALVTVSVWAGLVTERLTLDHVAAWARSAEGDQLHTLFVGSGAECVAAIESPAFRAGREYRPIGFVDSRFPARPGALGHLRDFSSLLAASGAQVVVVCGYLTHKQFQEVLDTALAAGCQVLSVPRSARIAGVHPTTVWRQGQPLVELTRPSLTGTQLFLKRALDLVGATLGLLLLAPLFGLVALLVRIESGGPAIFGHKRLGLNGRSFRCYKFRSMHRDAEQRLRSDPALYAAYVANNFKVPEAHDPRLTRVGRLLRRTSVDELPQLINVLKGEMSLVGPRPIVPQELALYGRGAPAFLSLKPGMTGAWQVNGRSHVGYPDRADIELAYVKNWSLARDLSILLKTVPAVLKGHGAH